MFKYILSFFTKKEELFGSRSYEWSKIINEFLKENPTFAACRRNKKLEIHHIKPFHLFPELELDLNNLITLCEDEKECHLKVGHGGNFKDYNPNVATDAAKVLANQTLFESVAKDAEKNRLIA